MRYASAWIPLVAAALLPADLLARQGSESRGDRFPGSAVVTVEQNEYLIRIECRVQGRPEAGFNTEPNRITREQTGGRYNMVALGLRPWQDTGDVVVSLDRFVAWMPVPTSVGGLLSLELTMSPTTVTRDGAPALVTYDMWQSGDRPPGREGVRVQVDCNARDPEAPAIRKAGA